MVTDEQLTASLTKLLDGADLEVVTAKKLRKHLEEEYGLDLTDKKAFIAKTIDRILSEKQAEEGDGAEEAEVPDSEDGEEGSAEEGDNWDSKRLTRRIDRALKESAPKKERTGGKGGFSKPCNLSPELQNFFGERQLSRPEVVKRLWAHIKEHNLQDPSNKRNINCDEAMQAFFPAKVTMFNMNKYLTRHVFSGDQPPEPKEDKEDGGDEDEDDDDSDEPAHKSRSSSKRKRAKEAGDTAGKAKRPGTGFAKPLGLSEQLSQFCGGERELARHQVVKLMWDYIKEHDLQDPQDKRFVICDPKMQALLDVDRFRSFGMMKLLSPHFSKL
eukprot:jgi/Chlat1/2904/Chrsp2S04655